MELPGLRAARLRRLLTQRELAATAGLTQATVQRIETGQQRARISTVRRLAEALGVDPRELIGSQNIEQKQEQ
jgi:transcriptional regulator with XRE-family HTH domain